MSLCGVTPAPQRPFPLPIPLSLPPPETGIAPVLSVSVLLLCQAESKNQKRFHRISMRILRDRHSAEPTEGLSLRGGRTLPKRVGYHPKSDCLGGETGCERRQSDEGGLCTLTILSYAFRRRPPPRAASNPVPQAAVLLHAAGRHRVGRVSRGHGRGDPGHERVREGEPGRSHRRPECVPGAAGADLPPAG